MGPGASVIGRISASKRAGGRARHGHHVFIHICEVLACRDKRSPPIPACSFISLTRHALARGLDRRASLRLPLA